MIAKLNKCSLIAALWCSRCEVPRTVMSGSLEVTVHCSAFSSQAGQRGEGQVKYFFSFFFFGVYCLEWSGPDSETVLSNTCSLVSLRAFPCCPHSWQRLSLDRWSGGLYGSELPPPTPLTHRCTGIIIPAGCCRSWSCTLTSAFTETWFHGIKEGRRRWTAFPFSNFLSSIKIPHNLNHTQRAARNSGLTACWQCCRELKKISDLPISCKVLHT